MRRFSSTAYSMGSSLTMGSMKPLTIIVAASANNVIGRDGELPWHISDDLKRFKAITMGKPIVMGRRTHESIGKALPGRQNIVITRQEGYAAAGCEVVSSPAAALRAAGDVGEVMIIGGGEIYDLFMNQATRIYLTRVDTEIDGDAFFPSFEQSDWLLVSDVRHERDVRHAIGFRFCTYERVRGGHADLP